MTEFYYKLGDYGSMVKFESADPPKVSCENLSFTKILTKPSLLERMQSKIENINPYEHDLFCLSLSILAMMGMSSNEIQNFRNNPNIMLISENKRKEYDFLTGKS